jgi:hypothetical protein
MARRINNQFNVQKVERLAARGATVVEIAEAFGVSKATFLRAKRENPSIAAAFSVGKADYAKERGLVVENRGGKLMMVPPAAPRDTMKTIDFDQIVLDHLNSNPQVNSFYGIRNSVRLSSDRLASIFKSLILERKLVKPVRDEDDNFRYFLQSADKNQWQSTYGAYPNRNTSRANGVGVRLLTRPT